MNDNNCIGPSQLVALAGILSIVIAKRLNLYEISLASAFFSTIGDNLGIISTQLANIMEQQEAENGNGNGNNNENSASAEDIEDLQAQINQLKCYIKKLENKMDC